MKKLFLLALCGVFLFGFSKAFADEPRVSTKDVDTFKDSVEKVKASLSERKASKFNDALGNIYVYVVNIELQETLAEALKKDKDSSLSNIVVTQGFKKYMDDKTADQIIEEAKKLQPELEQYYKEQVERLRKAREARKAAEDASKNNNN